jgi:hypothetical protein
MRGRISFKTKERYRKSMRDVIKGLGRKVLVYKQPIKNECANCFFDKFTGTSSGKCKWSYTQAKDKQAEYEASGGSDLRYKYFRAGRCPVCRGKGYIEIPRKVWVDCLVTWNPSEDSANNLTFTPAGTEGSTVVRLKTDPKHFDIFKNCDKLEIDGIECKLSKPPTIRGLGNQTTLIIVAFTTEKPQLDSGEVIKEY